MLVDVPGELAGELPWEPFAPYRPDAIVSALVAAMAPAHLLEATSYDLAVALLRAPRDGSGCNVRLHGNRASYVAAAAGALAYGLLMLEQSAPRSWEACRLALAALLAATADRLPNPERWKYDRELFGNARDILLEIGNRPPDTAAWERALPGLQAPLAGWLEAASRPRRDMPATA